MKVIKPELCAYTAALTEVIKVGVFELVTSDGKLIALSPKIRLFRVIADIFDS